MFFGALLKPLLNSDDKVIKNTYMKMIFFTEVGNIVDRRVKSLLIQREGFLMPD